ncbi:uncharacterized protein N7459_005616 [Penicillium hispanicum]|uniref:uncharacterized protein n=1 Tax=Penicillium hispanicum TaxID=1080232 RepID=UPI0025421CD7|nr:uncharacterized protein N7459_005616 [Penicillium hispanicum]KAJ5579631.1 hypothetical protein N7459_005616 [Penicillium hispanicum]
MLPKVILQFVFACSTLAAPATDRSRPVQKRAQPDISGLFADQHLEQVMHGVMDSMTLAKSVVTAPAAKRDAIFLKWFKSTDSTDKGRVMEVFQNITGPAPYEGGEALGRITVRPDRTKPQCEDAVAIMRSRSNGDGQLLVCDPALKLPVFGRDFGDIKAVTCDNIGDRVSNAMDSLGATFIHEYTHYTPLVVPPLEDATDDYTEYTDVWDTFMLDKDMALMNAETYAMFATEVHFSVECERNFLDPLEDSEPTSC